MSHIGTIQVVRAEQGKGIRDIPRNNSFNLIITQSWFHGLHPY
jgi:hypothetical protein